MHNNGKLSMVTACVKVCKTESKAMHSASSGSSRTSVQSRGNNKQRSNRCYKFVVYIFLFK